MYIYGVFRSSLLIESTDSMIIFWYYTCMYSTCTLITYTESVKARLSKGVDHSPCVQTGGLLKVFRPYLFYSLAQPTLDIVGFVVYHSLLLLPLATPSQHCEQCCWQTHGHCLSGGSWWHQCRRTHSLAICRRLHALICALRGKGCGTWTNGPCSDLSSGTLGQVCASDQSV